MTIPSTETHGNNRPPVALVSASSSSLMMTLTPQTSSTPAKKKVPENIYNGKFPYDENRSLTTKTTSPPSSSSSSSSTKQPAETKEHHATTGSNALATTVRSHREDHISNNNNSATTRTPRYNLLGGTSRLLRPATTSAKRPNNNNNNNANNASPPPPHRRDEIMEMTTQEAKHIDNDDDNDDDDDDDDIDEDPFGIIERFVVPHQSMIHDALVEIQAGQKESCWVWYLLPTPPFILDGRERGSPMNRKFALRSEDETKAYLRLRYTTTAKEMAASLHGRRGRHSNSKHHHGYGMMWDDDGSNDDGMEEDNNNNNNNQEVIIVDLRQNYIDLLRAIQKQLQAGKTLKSLLPYGDDSKAYSSFGLFERVGQSLGDEELYLLCRSVLQLVDRNANASRKTIMSQRSRFTPRNRQPMSL